MPRDRAHQAAHWHVEMSEPHKMTPRQKVLFRNWMKDPKNRKEYETLDRIWKMMSSFYRKVH